MSNPSSEPSRDRQTSQDDFIPPWRQLSLWRRLLRGTRNNVQWIILVSLAGATFLLWGHVRGISEIPAYAMSKSYSVGSPYRAALLELAVHNGQRVRKGQVLARLDPARIDAELALARAKVRLLDSRLSSEAARFRTRQMTLDTRLSNLEGDAREGLVSDWTNLRRWRAELKAIDQEIFRLQGLRERQLGGSGRLGGLKARRQALKSQIASVPMLMGVHQKKKKRAGKLLKELKNGTASARLEVILKPLRLELEMQRLRVQNLERRRERLVLRAPTNGLVKNISKQPGEVFDSGTTILTVVEEKPRHIIAYIRDTSSRKVVVGTRVKAHARSQFGDTLLGLVKKKRLLSGKVIGLGAVTILPGRFRDYIRRPIWARAVTIELEGNPELIPGERMHVTFLKEEG